MSRYSREFNNEDQSENEDAENTRDRAYENDKDDSNDKKTDNSADEKDNSDLLKYFDIIAEGLKNNHEHKSENASKTDQSREPIEVKIKNDKSDDSELKKYDNSDRILKNLKQKTLENLPDSTEVDKNHPQNDKNSKLEIITKDHRDSGDDIREKDELPHEITAIANEIMSDCTKQRSSEGAFYQHLKHAEGKDKISSDIRAYAYELRDTLNKMDAPEFSKAVIGGFDTTASSVGTPGKELKPIVGKNNPRHRVTYRIPEGKPGVFDNGHRSITITEIWGSGLKTKLNYDKHEKKWIPDPNTQEVGRDKYTHKMRKLRTGEHINKESGLIEYDKKLSRQVKQTKEKIEIDGEKIPVWKPAPTTGVGTDLAHTSDRYPRALSRHFFKYYDVNRKETVRLFSHEDHLLLEKDQKIVRKIAKQRFDKLNKKGKLTPHLDNCFGYARGHKELLPRFNNSNTDPPMDHEQKWIHTIPEDEMPKFNGKPYGDKTVRDIYWLMDNFIATGTTSDSQKFYCGNNPEVKRRFNEWKDGLSQKVELKGDYRDLSQEQKYVLTKAREMAEYYNTVLYHPLFGKMSIDTDNLKTQKIRNDATENCGEWSDKLTSLASHLDEYGVPKPKFTLPTDNIGSSEQNRHIMNEEFRQKNQIPFFDYNEIGKEIRYDNKQEFNEEIKISQLKDLNKYIDSLNSFSNVAAKSAEAFISSLHGHPTVIDGIKIKGTLGHYNQKFRGCDKKLKIQQYNIPAGTGHFNSNEDKEKYHEFWGPLLDRVEHARRINRGFSELRKYNSEILGNPDIISSMDIEKYTNSLHNDCKTQLNEFKPIQEEAYANFMQIFNYSGDDGRERVRDRPKTIEFIEELFTKSQMKFKSLINKVDEFKERISD